MTSQKQQKVNKKGFINLETIMLVLVFFLFVIPILYAGFSFSSIYKEQNEFNEKYYDFKINSFKAMRDSCIKICNDEDLSWSSADFDTARCFCSESDGKIIQYKLEINKDIWNNYFPKRLN